MAAVTQIYSVVFLAVFSVYLQTGGAIKCFECNSHNDSRCSLDVLPVELKKDCSEHKEGTKYTMCRKIVQHIDFEVNGSSKKKEFYRNVHNLGFLLTLQYISTQETPDFFTNTVNPLFISGTEFLVPRAQDGSRNPPDDRTIRGCGWDDSTYKGRCYQRSGFGGRQEVCSCLTDNCNGAPHVGTMPFLLGTSLLFLARCLF